MYDSAASRPKQGVFSVADFANDEATDDHHGYNMVGITLFLFQPAGCHDFFVAVKLLFLSTTLVIQVEQSDRCACVCLCVQLLMN